jgi:hypothetical protein
MRYRWGMNILQEQVNCRGDESQNCSDLRLMHCTFGM